MGYCVLCETKKNEYWFGSFCKECREIKNLGNVYGFDRVLEILRKCCIRDPEQLERKIDNHKKKTTDLKNSDELYDKPKTRSQRNPT